MTTYAGNPVTVVDPGTGTGVSVNGSGALNINVASARGGVANPTIVATGSVTAPAAAGIIAATAAIGAGSTWRVRVYISFGATPDAVRNWQVSMGGSTYVLVAAGGANGVPTEYTFDYVSFGATTTIAVQAIAAGAAGSVYNATIIATQLN